MIVFAKKAGDAGRIELVTGLGNVGAEIVYAPRTIVRALVAQVARLESEDRPRRENPERLTPEGSERMADIAREIASRLLVRVDSLEVGGVDLATLAPVTWKHAGQDYPGLSPAAIDLLDACDLLEILALRALEAQRPSAIEGKSSGRSRPPGPETIPVVCTEKPTELTTVVQ